MKYFFQCIFYLLLLFLSGINAHAQNQFKGKVVDETKNAIEGAFITLLKAESNEVVQYTQSSASGEFTFTTSATKEELKLYIQHFDFATYEIMIDPMVVNYPVTLVKQTTELQEIYIKPSPITQRNDTLSYNVESFSMKTDRVLEDVLKRLPGIEVNGLGQIKYQGESINRFYVEGLDLMKGRYSAVTRSISPADISRVEVYEEHQPIKLLEGKVATGKPALNIRLKNKISYSGTAKIGAGLSPFLWNATVNPLFFSTGFQAMVGYDTNNTGQTVSNKMIDFYGYDEYDVFRYNASTNPFLKIAENANPSIKRDRYLMNKSHLGNINVVKKLKKDWEIAGSVYYLNEKIESDNRTQLTSITYSNPTDSIANNIVYQRISSSNQLKEAFNSTFTLTKNEKSNYFKNVVFFNALQNKSFGNLGINTQAEQIEQKLTVPIYQVQNSLSTIIPITEKDWINVRSLIDFSTNKEDYFASPTTLLTTTNTNLNQYSTLYQQFKNQSFYTKNGLSYGWKLKTITIASEYLFTYKRTNFTSDLYGNNLQNWTLINDAYSNDLLFQEMSNTIQSKLSYRKNRWSANLNLPLAYTNVSLHNHQVEDKKSNSKLLFTPHLYLSYATPLRWTFKANVNYNSNFTSVNQLYPAYIFSELNFTSFNNQIVKNDQFLTRLEANFKDPFEGWFASVKLKYTEEKRSILLARSIDANGQQIIEAIEKSNTKNTKGIEVYASKLFQPIGTTIKGSVAYDFSEDPMLINTVYYLPKSQQNNYSISLSNSSLSWANVEYQYSYLAYKRNQFSENNSFKNTHYAKLSIIPFKQHSLIATIDYQQDKIQQQNFDNTFLDLMYRFTFPKRKIDLELSCSNILNHQQYIQVITNEMMTSVITAPIRPRQVLLSMRFSF